MSVSAGAPDGGVGSGSNWACSRGDGSDNGRRILWGFLWILQRDSWLLEVGSCYTPGHCCCWVQVHRAHHWCCAENCFQPKRSLCWLLEKKHFVVRRHAQHPACGLADDVDVTNCLLYMLSAAVMFACIASDAMLIGDVAKAPERCSTACIMYNVSSRLQQCTSGHRYARMLGAHPEHTCVCRPE